MLAEIALKVLLDFLPTAVRETIVTTAIRARITAYSTNPWPFFCHEEAGFGASEEEAVRKKEKLINSHLTKIWDTYRTLTGR